MQYQLPQPKHVNFRLILQLLLAIVILISLTPSYVGAQGTGVEPQIVTAYNDSTCGDQAWRITLEVWNVGSEGGDAYARAVIRGYDCINGKFGNTLKQQVGTFSGGPNGIVTIAPYPPLQFVDGKTVQHSETGTVVFIVQNPEAFQAWLAAPITSEYIYTTYGLRVQDTFGNDQWEQKSWSDQELVLLNDVLKELPPGLLKQLAVTRIIRSKTALDENGSPMPGANGSYYPCGSPPEKDCSSSSGAIRIFDNALTGGVFSNDPDGHKKFKGVILHELIHALQYCKDEHSIYYNVYTSPLVENYIDAIRPITDINNPSFDDVHNGWLWGYPPGQPPPRWVLLGAQNNNRPPTGYGTTNPIEDMSDSVMMYVYEPQRLKDSSMKRYSAIRDLVFGGIEYENGAQKRP